MAPCHVPGYRSPEYQRAFDELWAQACRGRVTVEQVRQEMLRLRCRYVTGPSPWPGSADAVSPPGAGRAAPAEAPEPTRRSAP